MSEDGRSQIMDRVRRACAASGSPLRRDAAFLEKDLPGRITRVRLPLGDDIEAHFRAKAQTNLMSLRDVARFADVPAVITEILAASNLAPDISVVPALAGLRWPATFTVRSGKARPTETVTVSLATAAIAETGSLVMCSGATAPSSLTYAGEVSFIVLPREDICARLEDGLAKVRQSHAVWPRAVNVVSGPSRTADVAGIVVRPAHGPKLVHVLVCAGSGAA